MATGTLKASPILATTQDTFDIVKKLKRYQKKCIP